MVYADGGFVEVGLPGHRSKVVFAALVVNEGMPVCREQLATAVWGDEAPPTWASALRTAVATVRKALAPCPPCR